MAIGDAAVAAGMSIVDGATTPANTIDTEINLSRDYIAEGRGATDAATANKVMKRDSAGRAKVATPSASSDIATKGYVDGIGTSAATASTVVKRDSAGRAKVATPSASSDIATKGYVDDSTTETVNWVEADKLPKSDVVVSTSGVTIANKVPRYDGSGRIAGGTPTASNHLATKAYVDSAGFDGGTVSGQIYLPNAYAANVGTWVVAYINGDGRIAKGASSIRYKEGVIVLDADALGDLFEAPLSEFSMIADEDHRRLVGRIAEDLVGTAAERFVNVDDQGRPDSIDEIALLIAQVAQLHERVLRLEAAEPEE